MGHVPWCLWRTFPSLPGSSFPPPAAAVPARAVHAAQLLPRHSVQVTPVPQTSPLWSLGPGRKAKPLWGMDARTRAGGMVWWQGKASTECTDSVCRNRSVFGKDRQGEEWLWWTVRAELSSTGSVRRWKKCSFLTWCDRKLQKLHVCFVFRPADRVMIKALQGLLTHPGWPVRTGVHCHRGGTEPGWRWFLAFFEQHPVLFYHAGHLGSHLEKPPIFLMFPAMENPAEPSVNCTEG